VHWVDSVRSFFEDAASNTYLVRERLQSFRNPGTAFLQDSGDDGWLKVTEGSKTRNGYTVGILDGLNGRKRRSGSPPPPPKQADREKTAFLTMCLNEVWRHSR